MQDRLDRTKLVGPVACRSPGPRRTGDGLAGPGLIVESLLGLQRKGNILRLAPCIPADWAGYDMTYRVGESVYRIKVEQLEPGAASRLTIDGVEQAQMKIPMVKDGIMHLVWAWIARPT